MAMTDLGFVFIFFPLSLLAAVIKPGWRRYVLLLLSLYYYACGSPEYFLLFLGMLGVNMGLVFTLKAVRKQKTISRMVLSLGILANVGLLFYYKYFNWLTEGFSYFFGKPFMARQLLLPLGISFFVFKSISLLIDVYKGTVEIVRNPVYGLLYLSYFGQIVSGPICRYN